MPQSLAYIKISYKLYIPREIFTRTSESILPVDTRYPGPRMVAISVDTGVEPPLPAADTIAKAAVGISWIYAPDSWTPLKHALGAIEARFEHKARRASHGLIGVGGVRCYGRVPAMMGEVVA
jgi:hypothetical protein